MKITDNCPVEATLDLIGGKYKALILWHLSDGSFWTSTAIPSPRGNLPPVKCASASSMQRAKATVMEYKKELREWLENEN